MTDVVTDPSAVMDIRGRQAMVAPRGTIACAAARRLAIVLATALRPALTLRCASSSSQNSRAGLAAELYAVAWSRSNGA